MEENIEITLKNNSEKENELKKQLEQILLTFDAKKWFFQKKIVIDEHTRIPNSQPGGITLNTNQKYVEDDYLLLALFVHEQIHEYECFHMDQVRGAIKDLRKLYPQIPIDFPLGANTEFSSYRHLITNFFEFQAMIELIGEEQARKTLEKTDHYTWIYQKVLTDTDKIRKIIKKHGLDNL